MLTMAMFSRKERGEERKNLMEKQREIEKLDCLVIGKEEEKGKNERKV